MFGPTDVKTFTIVPVDESDEKFWFAKDPLLFHLRTERNKNILEQFEFVLYFEMTLPLDAVDKTLNCLSIRWVTEDDLDHALDAKGISTIRIAVRE